MIILILFVSGLILHDLGFAVVVESFLTIEYPKDDPQYDLSIEAKVKFTCPKSLEYTIDEDLVDPIHYANARKTAKYTNKITHNITLNVPNAKLSFGFLEDVGAAITTFKEIKVDLMLNQDDTNYNKKHYRYVGTETYMAQTEKSYQKRLGLSVNFIDLDDSKGECTVTLVFSYLNFEHLDTSKHKPGEGDGDKTEASSIRKKYIAIIVTIGTLTWAAIVVAIYFFFFRRIIRPVAWKKQGSNIGDKN